MQTLRPLFSTSLFALCLFAAPAAAQTQAPSAQPERALVTAAGSTDRVRFAAPNRVARLRLEVLSQSGDVLFESSSRGSVLDWTLSDSQGGRLADGSYLCVLTVKDAAGRMAQRLTLVDIAGGAVTARSASAADLTARQAEAVGPVESESASVVGGEEPAAATLVAHDGTDGQLVTTAGDLSFRGGDFFTGRDRELMRLGSDGSLHLTGALNARGGIRFSDGTVLESAAAVGRAVRGAKPEKGIGDVTASATADRLAKFDAGGQLVDSAVVETGGNVGVGRTTGISYRLDVLSATTASGLRAVSTAPLGQFSGGGMSLEANAIPTGPDQRLGTFFFGASDGVNTFNPAIVAGYSAESWAGVGRGTYFEFEATAVGATNRSKVLRIAATGQSALFTAAAPTVRGLVVRGASGQAANMQEWQDAAGAPMAVLGSSGRLGLGTISPLDRLHVFGGNVRVSGAGNGIIFPDGTKQTTAAAGAGGISGAGTANTVPLWTGASTLGNSVITQSAGNVGIGTPTPTFKLQVVGGAGGGVSASSTGGYALFGNNPTGWAVGAEGNTRQRRDRGGWVKFMIYVDETGAITRCFNSFLADGGASQPGCGFTVTHTAGTGVYSIQFTEAVNDRFYSLAAKAASTTEIPRQNIGVNFEFDPNPNTLVVSTYLTSGPSTQTADASFILVVY